MIVRLTDTDYLGTPDARGDLEIADVLPGPYDVGIIDTALAPAGITLGTPLKLYAQRDSIVRAPLVEPPPEAFLRAKCARTEVHHWVTARVRRPDDTLVAGAAWELGENMGTGDEYVYGSGRTNTNGELGFCSALSSSRVLQVRVSDGLQPPRHVIVSILGDVTNILIELPARPR